VGNAEAKRRSPSTRFTVARNGCSRGVGGRLQAPVRSCTCSTVGRAALRRAAPDRAGTIASLMMSAMRPWIVAFGRRPQLLKLSIPRAGGPPPARSLLDGLPFKPAGPRGQRRRGATPRIVLHIARTEASPAPAAPETENLGSALDYFREKLLGPAPGSRLFRARKRGRPCRRSTPKLIVLPRRRSLLSPRFVE